MCLLGVWCRSDFCNPEDMFRDQAIAGHEHVLDALGIADEFLLFLSFFFASARGWQRHAGYC